MNTKEESIRALAVQKPRDDELDVFGMTHQGKVRAENQDHFLIASLHKQMRVHQTSLPDSGVKGSEERLAFLAMVADGVGGGLAGEEASRYALEAVAEYVTNSTHCYYTAESSDDDAFRMTLEAAAFRAHETLNGRSQGDPARRGMATTLTLLIGVWPRLYLLQVGDSRYYMLRGSELTQVTRDQTMAQELIDLGVLRRSDKQVERFTHVLSSAIGGTQTAPVVTGVANDWGVVHLLCSDGLTKHVSDERIREHLMTMTSSKQVCEGLLQDALDGGGRDNITLIVGRAMKKDIA
ncbi:MAG: protein phosphatase 2C domain-containing protein [Gemmatimonadaceae bacterium]